MLYFSLLCVLLCNLIVVLGDDSVSLEIENIGNDVQQSFGDDGFKQPDVPLGVSPIIRPLSKLPIGPLGHSNHLTPPAKSHRPTLGQIQFLIQNKNNPSPKVFRRATVIMTGLSGVNGLINLKQIVSFFSYIYLFFYYSSY